VRPSGYRYLAGVLTPPSVTQSHILATMGAWLIPRLTS
jgi:hypothetical protein